MKPFHSFVALILGAGNGSRMGSVKKILYPLWGQPVIDYVWSAVVSAGAQRVGLVLSESTYAQRHTWPQEASIYLQNLPRGTGDAVRCGLAILNQPTTTDGLQQTLSSIKTHQTPFCSVSQGDARSLEATSETHHTSPQPSFAPFGSNSQIDIKNAQHETTMRCEENPSSIPSDFSLRDPSPMSHDLQTHTEDPCDLLVALGDAPLVTSEDIQALLRLRASHPDGAVFVLSMQPDNPSGYGRLKCRGERLESIVEEKEASEEEKAIRDCWSGTMLINGCYAKDLIVGLQEAHDRNSEIYLTDVIQLSSAKGLKNYACLAVSPSLQGINTFEDLSSVAYLLQERFRKKALAQGVCLLDPQTVYLSYDTVFGQDVHIDPYVTIGPHVSLGSRTKIRAFSVLENTTIGAESVIGPFAHLQDSQVSDQVTLGNFVELKRSVIGPHVKAKHLSYIGDASLEAHVNIGAGTVFCNYDGVQKQATTVGKKSFIGANSALIAPLFLGENTKVGAGTVVTESVSQPHARILSRTPQTVSFKENVEKT